MWGENLEKKARVCNCQSYHHHHERHIYKYNQMNAPILSKTMNLLIQAHILLNYL